MQDRKKAVKVQLFFEDQWRGPFKVVYGLGEPALICMRNLFILPFNSVFNLNVRFTLRFPHLVYFVSQTNW